MRKNDLSEESKELSSLMKAQPQVDQKIKYYKGIMLSKQALHYALQERLEKGYTKNISLILGFIPIFHKHKLDSTEIARLNDEIHEIENTVYCQQQYYEHWLQNSKDYANRMDSITRECNQKFDDMIGKAMEVRNNIRLATAMNNYKNEDNDQQLKNEYYLYLKQEVNNSDVHGKKRRN